MRRTATNGWRDGLAAAAILVAATAARTSAQAAVQPADGGIIHASARPSSAPEDTARAVHLLSRATFGVRSSDVAAVLAVGEAAWLDAQLHPERMDDRALDARLARYPTLTREPAEMLAEFEQARRQRRRTADSSSTDARPSPATSPRPPSVHPRRMLAELVSAKLTRAVHSERQLEEVMTDFWFNHFNVHFGKGIDRYLIADYEASSIRPHVFGRFEDMLRATAQHPAMLFYLDNWTSAAPDSDAFVRSLTERQRRAIAERRLSPEQLQRVEQARRQGRERGINENYARELLELHTLGVDGGYTQDDVVAVARAFTGWTFRRPDARDGGDDIGFTFQPAMHDRGEKRVLGTTLPAGRGIEDGDDVIRMLAAHPTTARFLAGKLVARFVTDGAAPALVDELADVYLRTGGDLREVTRTLFTSDHFHDAAHRNAKVKSPFELVASALRVLDLDVGISRRTIETLDALGQLPYDEPAPTGFPARSEVWVNSGALLARMNFGLDLAAGRIDGIRPAAGAGTVDRGAGTADDRRGRAARRSAARQSAAQGPDASAADVAQRPPLEAALRRILPGSPTHELAARIRADLELQQDLTPRALQRRALGLALGSPEFQRR